MVYFWRKGRPKEKSKMNMEMGWVVATVDTSEGGFSSRAIDWHQSQLGFPQTG